MLRLSRTHDKLYERAVFGDKNMLDFVIVRGSNSCDEFINSFMVYEIKQKLHASSLMMLITKMRMIWNLRLKSYATYLAPGYWRADTEASKGV